MKELESRLRASLWGIFIADALAMPTHWYYGGRNQILAAYKGGITGYVAPPLNLPQSILNKSNVNGAGRGPFDKKNGVSIIGDVICHGKRAYWDPAKSIHYHATLQAGENTLEVQLCRVLMKSLVSTGGTFNLDAFRQDYVTFMTTPDSHQDTYASTCHRMFFANKVFGDKPLDACPDNDAHNVDTVDGLILPTIVALALSVQPGASDANTVTGTIPVASTTRRSDILAAASGKWASLVYHALHDPDAAFATTLVQSAAAFELPPPNPKAQNLVAACYLDSNLETAFHMLARHRGEKANDFETCVLLNANVGGENVHRGALLGAIAGARAGMDRLPSSLLRGLYHHDELEKEIDAFVKVLMK